MTETPTSEWLADDGFWKFSIRYGRQTAVIDGGADIVAAAGGGITAVLSPIISAQTRHETVLNYASLLNAMPQQFIQFKKPFRAPDSRRVIEAFVVYCREHGVTYLDLISAIKQLISSGRQMPDPEEAILAVESAYIREYGRKRAGKLVPRDRDREFANHVTTLASLPSSDYSYHPLPVGATFKVGQRVVKFSRCPTSKPLDFDQRLPAALPAMSCENPLLITRYGSLTAVIRFDPADCPITNIIQSTIAVNAKCRCKVISRLAALLDNMPMEFLEFDREFRVPSDEDPFVVFRDFCRHYQITYFDLISAMKQLVHQGLLVHDSEVDITTCETKEIAYQQSGLVDANPTSHRHLDHYRDLGSCSEVFYPRPIGPTFSRVLKVTPFIRCKRTSPCNDNVEGNTNSEPEPVKTTSRKRTVKLFY